MLKNIKQNENKIKMEMAKKETSFEKEKDLREKIYESFKEAMNEALTKPFIIANETGKEIQKLYIALSSDDDWGKNLWQNEEFFHSGYHIKLSSEDVGPYDIAMVDTDGNVYAKYKVRITEDLTIKFTQKDRLEK